ncbi:PDZ domain-containing protein [Tessaracoccus sp. HDW20]|uniref:YlbL family protein n=1 Tax=Tessaracoccus coleopterorum TaxID=2714950 RepID=UPI0018D29E64|nr:PDZ domain-containing protein [Tessaracoccus coleopterorum]NHB85925.1 PDZ domain-containing protein [Tessaracoccus coleopterorum]
MAIVSSLLFALLAVSLVVVPVPYVARRPGQTIDVLGAAEGAPVIEVTDAPTFETSGRLLMTTVSTTRFDASLSLPEAIFVHFGGDSDAMPRDVIYPPGKTSEQVESDAVAMMDSSRNDATVAALRAAVIPVTDMPRVELVSLSGPAADILQPGDLIESLDGQAVATVKDIDAILALHLPGDEVVYDVLRDGKQMSAAITLKASETDPSRVSDGIAIGTGYRFTPRVTFGVDPAVTGPSAGLIFALGIYDKITDGDLVGGEVVAGTGTIDPREGGRHRRRPREDQGAERDKATVFLVPDRNCADIGDLDTSVKLVKVATLKDAISALQLINEGNTSEVPTCG